ncbi:hypothetical protein J40TS1_13070 [Paenibacillus montaniterrae]|uniref:Uncharacterized protein n=1 Tax=Paenibacillus montaniterrae TaxID=429341 RepID=A0A920CWV7_9BACL|nr:hypothetical protein [Paenibacillus montaniterrae]GIP15665.1 hypothetical protein J40TS1_13070 [Paenibacillus montaniterrae]
MSLRECIFHFKFIDGPQTKMLRALIFLPDDRQPSIKDFIAAFAQLGYHVKLVDEQELIFAPTNSKETYKLDITKIEYKGGEEKAQHDGDLKAIIEQLRGGRW